MNHPHQSNKAGRLAAWLAVAALVAASPIASATVLNGTFVPGSGAWTLLPNGDFETGDTTGFTMSFHPAVTGSISAGSGYAYEGGYGGALTYVSGLSGLGIALTGPAQTLPLGEKYVMSAFVRSSGNPSMFGRLDRFGASSESYFDTGRTDWQFVYEEFTNASGFWYPRLVLFGDHSVVHPGDSLYIDEFALTRASDFRLPTLRVAGVPDASSSVALLGVACTALALVQRSRR